MIRDSLDYLYDIRDHARQALRFADGLSRQDFVADDRTAAATLHALTVIGEAARAIPADLRSRWPSVPWHQMTGMRNRLVHAYWGADLAIVYDTVVRNLPDTLAQIETIIVALENERPD